MAGVPFEESLQGRADALRRDVCRVSRLFEDGRVSLSRGNEQLLSFGKQGKAKGQLEIRKRKREVRTRETARGCGCLPLDVDREESAESVPRRGREDSRRPQERRKE